MQHSHSTVPAPCRDQNQPPRNQPPRSIAVMATEYPPCFCDEPTPWPERRYDGLWDEDLYDVLNGEEPGLVLEQRTCMTCGATKTAEVPT